MPKSTITFCIRTNSAAPHQHELVLLADSNYRTMPSHSGLIIREIGTHHFTGPILLIKVRRKSASLSDFDCSLSRIALDGYERTLTRPQRSKISFISLPVHTWGTSRSSFSRHCTQ